jgi:hypothetical protein
MRAVVNLLRNARHTGQTEGLDPRLEVKRNTQRGVVSKRSELERERQDRLHVAARADRGEQHLHPADVLTVRRQDYNELRRWEVVLSGDGVPQPLPRVVIGAQEME